MISHSCFVLDILDLAKGCVELDPFHHSSNTSEDPSCQRFESPHKCEHEEDQREHTVEQEHEEKNNSSAFEQSFGSLVILFAQQLDPHHSPNNNRNPEQHGQSKRCIGTQAAHDCVRETSTKTVLIFEIRDWECDRRKEKSEQDFSHSQNFVRSLGNATYQFEDRNAEIKSHAHHCNYDRSRVKPIDN